MTLRRFALLLLSATALAAIAPAARAADTSATTLEANLAPEVAADLIATYDAAQKEPAGFEPFQALYTRFQTVRKWEAYLAAIAAAGLKPTDKSYQAVANAAQSLAARGITRASIANAAIEKLAGVDDWHAADQEQARLVIDELGTLLTEITEPVQRLKGQLLLADIELDGDTPEAARLRVGTALADLRHVDDQQQIAFGQKLANVIITLRDPQAIEIISEIVGTVHDAEGREALLGLVAPQLAPLAAARLDAASESDPLALAWRFQRDRLAGGPVDMAGLLSTLAPSIDPLPAAIVLAAGVAPADRQAACTRLMQSQIAAGAPLRALNLRKALPAADCTAESALALATALTDMGMRGMATPLLADALTSVAEQNATLDETTRTTLGVTLAELGDLKLMDSQSTLLQSTFGKTALDAIRARSAVNALLRSGNLKPPLNPALASAISRYAPAGLMASVLLGDNRPLPPGAVAPDAQDIALFTRIGASLPADDDSSVRLAGFIGGESLLAYRLAVAEGFTGKPTFALDGNTPLGAALMQLESTLGVTPHAPLSAALGTLDPANIAADDPARDDLLLRLARAKAWAGERDSAAQIAQLAANPEPITLAIAAIEGQGDEFGPAAATIRAGADFRTRVAAFRALAEGRAARLAGGSWIAAATPDNGAAVRVVRASTGTGATTQVTRTPKLAVSVAPAPDQLPPAPPIPSLAVEPGSVIAAAPYPSAGEGGIIVGGEGRYVRLARFESPHFDGEQNNGVRDYIYQTNGSIAPEFIFLNSGVFTIADTIAAIGRADVGAITLLPGGKVRFNRPLAIGPDATLILSGAEVSEVQLNATLGSYLVNAGHLYAFGTRIVGYNTDADAPAYFKKGDSANTFRPFLVAWSGSVTDIADSEMVALGYSGSHSYGLSLTSGPPDEIFARAATAAPTGVIVNNSFDNTYYGFYAYEAEHVQVIGNEYRDSIIYGIDPHDRSRDLNLSLNTAYGTFKKHGIILSRDVDDSTIVGNLTFDNHGSGIMLDRASVGTVIAANTVHDNEGDGIAIFESPCTYIGANDITANGRSGVLVRNSWDIAIHQNIITDNEGAGVQGFISDLTKSKGSEGRNFDLDPYQPVTSLSISTNAISGNGAGIQTAGVSAAELYNNRFRDQSKRLFGGDLDGLGAVLLQNAGKTPTLVATTCIPVLTMPKQCRLIPFGVQGVTGGTYKKGAGSDYCLGDSANLQAQAFTGAAP